MGRLTFLDGLRGIALILMVINHTSRDWLDATVMPWERYYLVYASLLLPAPIFLFLAGFCLPIGYHRKPVDEPFVMRARRYLRRGIGIVAAGYLLNALLAIELAEPRRLSSARLAPDPPVWWGGVLQTIGLAIIVLGPMVPWLRSRANRWALAGLAVLAYIVFTLASPALAAWTANHQISRAIFNDFPPWPWLSAAVLGLVLGWTWLDARARGAAAERAFFVRVTLVGAACVGLALVWEWLIPTAVAPRFGFPRDFSINRHWTPRGVTTVFIIGGVALLLSFTYWLMERRRVALGWLVVFGQTALMLYFTHQLIEMTLVSRILGVRFDSWPLYIAANAIFLVLLVYVGRGWLAIKAWRAR
jgi:uncharacterized membrane protein